MNLGPLFFLQIQSLVTNTNVQQNFCNQSLAGLLSLPEDSSMTIEDFQKVICQLDLSALAEELEDYISWRKVIQEVSQDSC